MDHSTAQDAESTSGSVIPPQTLAAFEAARTDLEKAVFSAGRAEYSPSGVVSIPSDVVAAFNAARNITAHAVAEGLNYARPAPAPKRARSDADAGDVKAIEDEPATKRSKTGGETAKALPPYPSEKIKARVIKKIFNEADPATQKEMLRASRPLRKATSTAIVAQVNALALVQKLPLANDVWTGSRIATPAAFENVLERVRSNVPARNVHQPLSNLRVATYVLPRDQGKAIRTSIRSTLERLKPAGDSISIGARGFNGVNRDLWNRYRKSLPESTGKTEQKARVESQDLMMGLLVHLFQARPDDVRSLKDLVEATEPDFRSAVDDYFLHGPLETLESRQKLFEVASDVRLRLQAGTDTSAERIPT